MEKYDIAIVGATGLVGRTLISLLNEYSFPLKNVKLFASQKSVGKIFNVLGKEIAVEKLTEEVFKERFHFVFFCAGGEISKTYAPLAVGCGAIVIDNSSVFRMKKEVPLVVPEVNFDACFNYRGIVSNPNCSTVQCVLPLYALSCRFGVKRVNYNTYQAVSGSGQKGINALYHALTEDKCEFYPECINKTCLPEIGDFTENGYTQEEVKMIEETRKILGLNDLPVSATCVRVPVENCHAVSVSVELAEKFSLEEVRAILSKQKGVVVTDNEGKRIYPTGVMANGRDEVFVGRLRRDFSTKNGLLFYCVSDNLRKGAASNALQIATEYIKRGWV